MKIPRGSLCKPRPAVVTHERPFSGVCPFMPCELSRRVKPLIAKVAMKVAQSTVVAVNVFLHPMFKFKRSITLVALELFWDNGFVV